MKTIFLSIVTGFCFLISNAAHSQSIVIATTSSGGEELQEENIRLDFSIGQVFTELKTDEVTGRNYQEGIFHGSFESVLSKIIEAQASISNMELFPNPASNFFMINTPEAVDGSLFVYSVNGSLVIQLENYVEGQRIETAALPDGQYVALFESKEFKGVAPFIVHRE